MRATALKALQVPLVSLLRLRCRLCPDTEPLLRACQAIGLNAAMRGHELLSSLCASPRSGSDRRNGDRKVDPFPAASASAAGSRKRKRDSQPQTELKQSGAGDADGTRSAKRARSGSASTHAAAGVETDPLFDNLDVFGGAAAAASADDSKHNGRNGHSSQYASVVVMQLLFAA